MGGAISTVIMVYSKTPAVLGLPMHTEYGRLSEGEGSRGAITHSSHLSFQIPSTFVFKAIWSFQKQRMRRDSHQKQTPPREGSDPGKEKAIPGSICVEIQCASVMCRPGCLSADVVVGAGVFLLVIRGHSLRSER